MTPAVMERPTVSLIFAAPELLRPATDNQAAWSDWFTVLKAGQFERHGDTIDITEQDLDNAIEQFRSFQQQGLDTTVDYDHTAFGDGRAAGWYRDLKRDGANLRARVEWTDNAKQLIQAGEYRYFSAEFHPAWKDQTGTKRGFTLLAGGLTNRPFLKDLGPVALSEDVQTALDAERPVTLAEVHELVSERLAGYASETHGAMSTATDTPTVTLSEQEATDLRAKAARADTLQTEVDTLKAKADEAVTLSEKIVALSARVEAAEAKVEASDQRVKAAETELFNERFTGMLTKARNEGRIDAKPETTEKWQQRADKLGLDTVAELLSEFAEQTIPTRPIGHGNDKPVASTVPEGVNETAFAFHERVKAYQSDHPNTSYVDAAAAVEKAGR